MVLERRTSRATLFRASETSTSPTRRPTRRLFSTASSGPESSSSSMLIIVRVALRAPLAGRLRFCAVVPLAAGGDASLDVVVVVALA